MPARILSLPFIIAVLFLLYLTWEYDDKYFLYMIAPAIMLALIWTLAPQINWWWYQKYPPKLDPPLYQIIQRNLEYYQQLSVNNKEKFRNRTALFMEGNDFSTQTMDPLPEDLKGMIAVEAVKLTFGYKQFLFKNFEKVIVYPKPFPSPQYPKFFHASETYHEDGVVLFAAQQIATAFFHPKDYVSLPLYEYAKVFIHTYPQEPYPEIPDSAWEKLEEISGFSLEAIQRWINLPPEQLDILAMTIHHFFTFPVSFQRILPDLFENMVIIFKQNPSISSNPVVI